MRHTPEEITIKLGEAAALAAAGKTQREIAKTLGISVMTFHRWRHAQAQRLTTDAVTSAKSSATPTGSGDLGDTEALRRIAELQRENARLRKLVTDLLLQKVSLEDDLEISSATALEQDYALRRLHR